MSKRNFILLIIILVIIAIMVFGFLYLNRRTTTPNNSNNLGTNFISLFNPFSNKKTTPPVVTPPVNVSGYVPPTQTTIQKLVKVSSMPIAGFGIFSKERLKTVPVITPAVTPADNTNTQNATMSPATTTPNTKTSKTTTKPTPPLTEFMPAVRYVDRATGNIYQTFLDKIGEQKFSGTVIPEVYEASFGNNGQSVIMRYLKTDDETIETFVGTLPKEYLGADTTTVNEVKGSFLPENIKDLSMSADTLNAFYLFNTGDNMTGATVNILGNKKTQIFSSPFTEWLSQWPNNKMITLTTKPASGVPGYMYTTDQNGKNFSQVLGNINGLTTETSPNGKLVLYGDNTLSLYLYNKDTKVSNSVGVKTLPEKCAWGNANDVMYCAVPKSTPSGLYPDSWYQGIVSFSDQIWKIDIKTGNTTMILDPLTISGGEDVDGIKLATDAGENYLLFVNKKDSYLWKFDLK